MRTESFRLCLILGHLDTETEIAIEQIIILVDELFNLPHRDAWKIFVEAAIYEPDTQKVVDLMQATEALPQLIEDLSSLSFLDHSRQVDNVKSQQLAMLPKLMKCFYSMDKTAASILLRYCKDEDMQSFQSYYIKYATIDIQRQVAPVGPSANFRQPNQCSYKTQIEPSNKMKNEIQKIMNAADHSEYFKQPIIGKEVRFNSFISEAERTANSDLDVIDDQLRDLAAMSKQLSAPQFLGISVLS